MESLRKADEWREKLFIVSMDVATAFDSVSAQVLGDVLLERGATISSVAAAVRENLDLSARPCMGNTKSPPFRLEVGMRQGGPRTPSGWNQVMAVLVEELLLLWANKKPAVSWAPEWKPFEILVWADNIFLVSSSIIDIVQKTQDIEHVFGKKDLYFNQKSLEILPSKSAEENVARVWLNADMEFSWVSELVVLGCHLDGSGSTEAQVQGRLEQGRKMFGRMRSLLGCSKIPEEERLRMFYSTVVPCVLWGSGCWIPSAKIQQLLVNSRNKVAPLYAGWSEAPRRCVDGLVSSNKTCSPCVEDKDESSVPMAQSLGRGAWLGWSCGSERQFPSRSCCNFVALREMVGDHEKYWGWFTRPQLAASETKLGTQF